MTVYVDKLMTYPGKGEWCHMMSDESLEELHAFASKIGMERRWFQNIPEHPHYDLRPRTRAKAIRAGAIEADGEQMMKIIKHWRSRLNRVKSVVLVDETDPLTYCKTHNLWYYKDKCPACELQARVAKLVRQYKDLLNESMESMESMEY